ncbi:hypothetical protein [Pseudoclavibacter helvolus]|uniref:hypothetical protein n=1 Tax=Pseudoclavibacter helvolus TaxID=255205 RepID=UPI003C74BC88
MRILFPAASTLPPEPPVVIAFPTSVDLVVTGVVVVAAVLFVVGVWTVAALQLRGARALPLDLVGRVERAQRINRTAVISTLVASGAMVLLVVTWLLVSLLLLT